MEIKKGCINLKETKGRMSAGNLVSGDVVLYDTMPDMEEVLLADAKARVCDAVYQNGKLDVSGVVDFNVIYKPEEGSELKSCCQSFDFLQSFDVKSKVDAEFRADVYVEHISFVQVNSRKIAAKVMLCVVAYGIEEKSYEPIAEISGDEIECRYKKYSIYVPMSDTVTDISIDDIFTIPEEKPDIAEILKTDAWANVTDTKVMNGKVMIYADLNVCTLYSAADEKGTVTGVVYSVPFTEIAEAPGADEQSTVNVVIDVERISVSGKGDLNGNTRIINLNADMKAIVKVSKTVAENIVDDCYFLNCRTNISREKMDYCEYVTSERGRITERQTIDASDGAKIAQIISCTAKPIIKEVKCIDKKAMITGNLVSFVVFRDENGVVKSAVAESNIGWEKMIGCDCEIEADMRIQSASAECDGNKAQVLANVDIYMKALTKHTADIMTGCAAEDAEDCVKFPGLVIYFAKDGDTVWNVAKKYRTKREKIISANGLEKEILEQGRRILIPKA